MGPLANERRLEAMETLVADATARGAQVTAGGARIGNRGYYFPLTVWPTCRTRRVRCARSRSARSPC
jgi:acyl-CoA reductase-like NAD-dependent aldehyde dehydrogenase